MLPGLHLPIKAKRKNETGTWLNKDFQKAYIDLHRSGYAHSVEVWQENKIVGGLYGVSLGSCFFGESMFSNESNASKFAFIKYIHQLKKEGVGLVDCQVYTAHLESLGATMIDRKKFIALISENL